MREKIRFNQEWHVLVNPPPEPVVKNKPGMYLGARTERLKWGPGSYEYLDSPEWWIPGNELVNEKWQVVNLPHDYIISQRPDPGEAEQIGSFRYTPAWYRKHFPLTEADRGKRITLFFEAIAGNSDLYLNGCLLTHHYGSYDSFELDITDLVRFDKENVLAVRTDPDSLEGWWYAGGGIYRNVWLIKTDPVFVDLWGVFVPVKKLSGTRWSVPVQVTLGSIAYADEEVGVRCEILDPTGEKNGEILLSGTVPARGKVVLRGETEINSPKLWDLEMPNLYTMRVLVSRAGENGQVFDRYDQRFGFREIVWTAAEGISLNGRPIKVKGVCMHLDYGLSGKATPDNVCKYKVRLIKEMGANALRASHYPHQAATMDACDELGLLVMNENRRFETNEESMAKWAMLLKRDRNRPSVFLWSTSNEETVYHRLEQGLNIHKALEFAIHKLDPFRPVTAALAHVENMTIQCGCEVIGINYSLKYVDEVHRQFPEKLMLSSENCATGSIRGWYWGNSPARGFLDARDQDSDFKDMVYGRENTWKFLMERPWIAGGFQWTGIEYRGEAHWPRICSISGAIDLFLQKKDAFYQNQSHWLERPMVHLLPHWNFTGLEDTPINVWVYTNCEEAELFLNGESLGRQIVEKYTHLEWSVPYQPGVLEVVAYNQGERVAVDRKETTGPAVALKLALDTAPENFNGEEFALLTCTAVDKLGREVPDASPMVHFDCVGGVRLVGTGSSNIDHTPVPSPDRQMYAGRISVALCPSAGAQDWRLFARSEYLKSTYFQPERRLATNAYSTRS